VKKILGKPEYFGNWARRVTAIWFSSLAMAGRKRSQHGVAGFTIASAGKKALAPAK
jgi:hypothetical protein